MGEVYGTFGLEFSMALSTRPEGYLGELELWNKAEVGAGGRGGGGDCRGKGVGAPSLTHPGCRSGDARPMPPYACACLACACRCVCPPQAALTDALKSTGLAWTLNEGDGAFYGPKIDITVYDALKRKFQCATVQLDFQLPIRWEGHSVPEGLPGTHSWPGTQFPVFPAGANRLPDTDAYPSKAY